jgi:hypothetical protein
MRLWYVLVVLLVATVGRVALQVPFRMNETQAAELPQIASLSALVSTSAERPEANQMRSNVEIVAQVASTGTFSLENTYVALRPSTTGAGIETIVLTLDGDNLQGNAQIVTNAHNDKPPVVESGTWQAATDGTLTLTLTERDGRPYDEPVVITFKQVADTLESVASDAAAERFGAEGLRLRQAAAVASDLDRALFTADLDAGFALDPAFISVNGGGEIDAHPLGGACAGFVHRQPVVKLNWSGAADAVRVFFVSDGDPSLVVAGPDGTLFCNDDTHPLLLDPTVVISDPITGTYRIWVGSAAPRQLVPGVLVMTTRPEVNLGTFDLGALIKRPVLPERVAARSESSLRDAIAAMTPKLAEAPEVTPAAEVTVPITAAGTVPLFLFNLDNPQCNGLLSATPDYLFRWKGDAEQLRIFFEGNADATLLVFGTSGDQLACNDDATPGTNLNPLVVIDEPQEGAYGVWVGRLDSQQPVTGTLTITAAGEAAPAALAPVAEE